VTALVLDFGGRMEGVFGVALEVLGRSARVLILPKGCESEMVYDESSAEVGEALEAMASGNASSVQMHGDDTRPFVASLYCPRFAGDLLADWSGSIEGLDRMEATFEQLQGVEGLRYIALSVEESPDFETQHVTQKTFPWEDWRLVAGAVRGDDGPWLVRYVRSVG
jgi:hypothetical protein